MTTESTQTVRYIAGRMSLRPPQAESLERFARAIELAPEILRKERDDAAILAKLRAEFPTLSDFERDFPSFCFALATGVGKTRLMGAFVAYLHLAHGIKNFFVLAPNLTIYEKLQRDFAPNNAKYVLKGISEFAVNPPEIVTGENYEYKAPKGRLFAGITINIFNISKINSEVRGGKSPRIKRLSEYIGDSYFNLLANQPDLVLLMDESHRYRASAGIKAINELNPLLGLELTATPFVEARPRPVAFKNVIVDYPLARALEDGFVKEPAAVTQRDFNPNAYSAEQLERIKLEDGIRVHENTKVELLTYARENGLPTVKPFMLIIARDTAHAAQLLSLVESPDFYDGRYKGRAIQVDSSQSGEAEDRMVARLLAVESFDEPTEIVIHVNMLKEGWDVTNLYTIVPLRAANARTLVEQSIGRGLRLPYGRRTKNAVVDRLNIIAHDRFQEVIDEANRGDSPIRLQQLILEAPESEEKKESVTVKPYVDDILHYEAGKKTPPQEAIFRSLSPTTREMVESGRANDVIQAVKKVIYSAGTGTAKTSRALLDKETQETLAKRVSEQLTTPQKTIFADEAENAIREILAETTTVIVENTIDIPKIIVTPKGESKAGFRPFTLDTSNIYLQPRERTILIHDLHDNTQSTLSAENLGREERPEDYIVFALIDFDDIDYTTQADLLYELAGQVVAHLRSYLPSEEDIENVLDVHRTTIAKTIHAQMQEHFYEEAEEYEANVTSGFSPLKECNYSIASGQSATPYTQTVPASAIKNTLFGGFRRCLYPCQKFDSDTERRFAAILERGSQKWFKPAKGQFLIDYRLGGNTAEYIPDFVAETENCILLIETKAERDMLSPEVQAKKIAAATWCKHASEYAETVGSKPWKYLLIPHNEVTDAKMLGDFFRFEERIDKGASVD